jgi:hypothetical protein
MAKENLKNLHIYGEKTDFMDKYIRFMAIAPKVKDEYLLMTTQAPEAVAFAKVYQSEHPEIMGIHQEIKNKDKIQNDYFYLLFRHNRTLYIKTIIKH